MRVRVPPSAPSQAQAAQGTADRGDQARAAPADQHITIKAAQKLVYRIAGVPVILRRAFAPEPRDTLGLLRDTYARHYFHTVSRVDRRRVRMALLSWPFAFLGRLIHFTRLNGRIIEQRYGRSISQQVIDQIHFYLRHGILPRWYYIFSLYEDRPRQRPQDFLNRFETKLALFRLLNWPGTSPLNDKAGFAAHCRANGIDAIPLVLIAEDGELDWLGAKSPKLPARDLFVKPTSARGGKGAERWDHAGKGQYRSTTGQLMSGEALLERIRAESSATPRLVQPRMVNHADISDLSNGALCTARIMTCLDEKGAPEVVAAVFRMAIGKNVVVDNIHAGGIAAEIGLATGRLGPASNLGDDVRLGWLSSHPDSGAAIEGRILPLWKEARQLATQAHRAFTDRTVIGWDVAITSDGPVLVEGNSGPDVDLLQRPMRRGLAGGRLGELMAFHLIKRGFARPI